MKKIVGFVLILLTIAAQTFAMQMGQPEEIGSITWQPSLPSGYIFQGESSNTGTQLGTIQGKPIVRDGYATFGKGPQTLRFYAKEERFGGANLDYTYDLKSNSGTIFSIPNDSSVKLYLVLYDGKGPQYELLGVRSDGICVRYFDTYELRERGVTPPCDYTMKAETYGDTLKLEYRTYPGMDKVKYPSPGGFLYFKWDEDAQWFGVENVPY